MPDRSPAGNSPRLSIENFRGDFDELAALMQASWAENASQPLLYTAEFLSSCFEYPGVDFFLAPAIYDRLKPVAFVAGFPRRVRFKGHDRKIIVITFLTILPEYKKKGLGIILWSELVKRARAAGFDGMVNYCVDGEPMNAMIIGCCNRLQLPIARIYSARYMSTVLRAGKREAPPDGNGLQPEDAVLNLSPALAESQPLARLWTRPEAQWQCVRRSGAITACHSDGVRMGVLTGYIMSISNQERTKCLLIEEVLWGALEIHERRALLQRFLDNAANAGARIATVPVLGYADMEPFKKARFQGTRRVLHSYLTLWSEDNADFASEPLPSMYLDVF